MTMLHELDPKKFRIEYRHIAPEDGDTILLYVKGQVMVKLGQEEIAYPVFEEVKPFLSEDAEIEYLFAIDDQKFFTVLKGLNEVPEGYGPQDARDLRRAKPMDQAYAGITGRQTFGFYSKNRFCGRCGAPMVRDTVERAVKCPECRNLLYPQICPSVIVGVRNGDCMMLTRYSEKHSPFRGYALIAGYVETGESVEDCVRREILEEVGLKVKNITYFNSQPWPVSGALLLGYYCDLDGSDQVTLDEDELCAGDWVRREDMEDRSEDISLTSAIMEAFRTGKI